jgi:signal transduction histidine kinase/CheY-like chemotaxis protein
VSDAEAAGGTPRRLLPRLSFYVVPILALALVFVAINISRFTDAYLRRSFEVEQRTRYILKVDLIVHKEFSDALLAIHAGNAEDLDNALSGLDSAAGYLESQRDLLPPDDFREFKRAIGEQGARLRRIRNDFVGRGLGVPAAEMASLAEIPAAIHSELSMADVEAYNELARDGSLLHRQARLSFIVLICLSVLILVLTEFLRRTIGARDRLAAELQRIGSELEARVEERTLDLSESNEKLRVEIEERKKSDRERARLEDRLQHSQKMEAIGTLAGGIAHDFNNILGGIMGYAELAMLKRPGDASLAEDLQPVLQSAERAGELVKQILTFSRTAEQPAQPLQPNPIVKEALKLLRASIPSSIEIRASVTSASFVMADPTEILRIVMNLCTNAAMAMREQGGVLEIGLDDVEIDAMLASGIPGLTPGRHIRLRVKDSGCGMAADVKRRIFEPFFTTRPQGEGSGMGLSVVHGIVKSRRGAILVDSKPGGGSTFDVFLPVLEEIGRPGAAPDDASLPGTERILFVDDEPMAARLAEQMLGAYGYRVSAFTRSLDALEIFLRDPFSFDLVITDMTMPGLTGDVLAARIRAVRPDIPVILCTGHSDNISAEKAREAGIDEFAMKPIVGARLSRIIRQVLDRPRR